MKKFFTDMLVFVSKYTPLPIRNFFAAVRSRIKPIHLIISGAFLLAIAFGLYVFFKPSLSFPANVNIVKSSGAYAYKNTTNVFKTQFKSKVTDADSIVFTSRLGQITFFTPENQPFGKINSNKPPVTNGGTITYPDIFDQMDVRYTISSTRLLEEFIVKEPAVAKLITRIEQNAKTDNTFVQNKDGSITFSKGGKEAFTLPHPVMYETGNPNKASNGIVYEIKKDQDHLVITKVITAEGKAWLADKTRKYPIAIDLVIDNADTFAANNIIIDNADAVGNWTSSDNTDSPISQEATIKNQGSGSVKTQTTADTPIQNIDLMEYSSDAAAQAAYVSQSPPSPATYTATGGTITTSGLYTVHTFTSSGTFTPAAVMDVDALVVAGGGGGGKSASGWGGPGGVGAGGMVYQTVFRVAATPITVTVGGGGAGATTTAKGTTGNNSVFSTLTASGGGGGGAGSLGGGLAGGSGGGGAYSATAGGAGTAYQGTSGGTGNSRFVGVGDGAGGAGSAGTTSASNNGGGAGGANTISGSSVTYSAGGNTGAVGTFNGTANTGNGGSGGYDTTYNGGNGGSGVVIIRYLTNPETVADSAGFRTHVYKSYSTFNPGGSINVEPLVVAGGGGGGRSASGWGGPGGGGGGGDVYKGALLVADQGYGVTIEARGLGDSFTQAKGGHRGSFGIFYQNATKR